MCWSTGGATGMTWGHNCNCPNCTCGGSSVNVTMDYNYVNSWTQDFSWALTQVKTGFKVRRKVWVDNVYVHQITDQTGTKYIVIDHKVTGGHFKPTQDELLATDWEIYVEKCGECGRPT